MTLASSLLLASVGILYSLYAERFRLQDLQKQFPKNPRDLNLPVQKTYDFIVVGAGDAGCILARRLADAKFTVLLLETGGNAPPLSQVIGLAPLLENIPQTAYLYRSTPQNKAALIKNGVILTVAGKAMGGGTTIHDCLHQRGSPFVYDEWASLTGNSSWRYENMLKYFFKNEKYMGGFPLNGQHSRDGVIAVTRPEDAPGRQLFIQAGEELGFPIVDSNGPQTVGFSYVETTTERGRRISTYTAYIKPIENSSKFLTVHRYSPVSQVLFDDDKNAIGVLYKQHGVPRVARASKEVILSAGSYVSPLILINSGIGPTDQLQKANITTIKILPAGKNLQNHVILNLNVTVDNPNFAYNAAGNISFSDFRELLQEGQGDLTTSTGIAVAFLKSSRALSQDGQLTKGGQPWPDIQIGYSYKSAGANQVNYQVALIRPRSVGRITMNTSATGFDDDYLPIIDFNYFDDESDLDVVVEGINLIEKIVKTRSMQKIGARVVIPKIKECGPYRPRSRDYLKCIIKFYSSTTHHTSGTCRMGRSDDPRSVVDPELRVLGVQRLRVCDASISPIIMNANTATPTGAIAEKTAADLIREYNGAGSLS